MSVTKVEKPWGHELHWAKTDRYVGKVIHINKGHALSLQYHNLKDETIFVWSGRILFEIDVNGTLTKREMGPGDAAHVAKDHPSHDGNRRLGRLRGLNARVARRRQTGRPVRASRDVDETMIDDRSSIGNRRWRIDFRLSIFDSSFINYRSPIIVS